MARAALRPGLVVLLHKIGQGDARRVVATHVEANGHVQRLEVANEALRESALVALTLWLGSITRF